MKYKISADMKIDKKEIYFFNYDINNFEVIMIIHNQRLNGVENVLKSYYFIFKYVFNKIL